MKRPTIITKLPEIAFLAFLIGAASIAVGAWSVLAWANLYAAIWILNGFSFWAIGVTLIALNYCCSTLEQLSKEKKTS